MTVQLVVDVHGFNKTITFHNTSEKTDSHHRTFLRFNHYLKTLSLKLQTCTDTGRTTRCHKLMSFFFLSLYTGLPNEIQMRKINKTSKQVLTY